MKTLRPSACAVLMILFLSMLPVTGQADARQATYQEDFEDGHAQGWDLDQAWEVSTDGSNHVLAGQGPGWARYNDTFPGDLRLSFRLKLLQGRIHLVVRLNDIARYFIGFESGGSDLNKQYFPSDFRSSLAESGAAHSLAAWHQIEIVLAGDRLEFFVDGSREWSYTDPEPLTSGRFAFEALDGARAYVDDIQLERAAAAPGGAQNPLSDLSWVRLGGPAGGLGYDIRMRPDDPQIMYVTDANAGVHRSTDGGRTWLPMNEGIDLRTGQTGDLIPVFCLTIDPNDNDIVWIGLQGLGGIYRSTDGGVTWVKRVAGIRQDGLTIRGITIQPGNSEVVYAAGEIDSWRWAGEQRVGHNFDMTRGIVYKSVDGGDHWTVIWQGDNLARYVWIDPRATDTLYVSTGIFDREAANTDVSRNEPGGVGILKSTDGEVSWTVLAGDQGLTGLFLGSLFMHPEDPDMLMAGAGHDYWSKAYDQGGMEISPAGVFLTEDGGLTWTQTLAHQQIYSVEYCLGDPDIAYAAGPFSVYRSEDRGRTWQMVSGGTGYGSYWGPPGVVAGNPIDVQCDPRDADRLFVNNYGGGNFLSEDGGRNWVDASTGYSGAMVFGGLALDPDRPNHILAGGRSGLFLSDDGGVTWSGLAYPPARHTEITALAVDPTDANRLFAAPWDLNQLAFSRTGGTSWELIDASPSLPGEAIRIVQVVYAPSDPRILYAALGRPACLYGQPDLCSQPGGGVFSSRDGGQTWRQANDAETGGLNVLGLAVDPGDPDRVYAAAGTAGLYRTANAGQDWERLPLEAQVWSLAVDPADPAVLYAGGKGGVYRSQDGGGTWRQMIAGMPAEALVRAIVLDPARAGTLWAADYFSGVYLSTDSGEGWFRNNTGLSVRAVVDLVISGDGQTLYAATQGGGVYRLSVHDQAYFDSLAPTPAPSTPFAATIPPAVEPTAAPGAEPGLCRGAALLPLAALVPLTWRAARRRPVK